MNDSTRIRQRQHGTAAIELALVLPLLVILLFGIVEIGRALHQENTLMKAVSVGSRFVARAPGAVTADCLPGTNWAAATDQARALVINGGQPAMGPILPGLDAAGAVQFTIRADAVGGDTVCVVQIDARTDFQAVTGGTLIPFLNIDPPEINAQEEERYIGD